MTHPDDIELKTEQAKEQAKEQKIGEKERGTIKFLSRSSLPAVVSVCRQTKMFAVEKLTNY